MAKIFENILTKNLKKLKSSGKKALDWFKKKTKSVSKSKRTSHSVSKPLPGKMYFFSYDPKYKKTLPYYDAYPLIFMVEPAPKGFYGINLHYLPPRLRAKLMDGLYTLISNDKYDRSTKLKISYKLLKSSSKLRFYKPAFKHYLWDHVRSKFIEIESSEWDNAISLPSTFRKATKEKVWKDSIGKI